jgi:AcrR family transcriptional regulator
MASAPVPSNELLIRPTGTASAFDHKLDAVLGAAARVMAREGYGRSTIRMVAREADMSLAGLYHYFASKEELLFLIQFHTFETILNRLDERLAAVTDPRERLRVMVVNHLEHFLSRVNELKVCAGEMETLSGDFHERVRALRQRYLKTTLEIVESISEEAGKSRVDSWPATLHLFGMLNWIYMWYPAAEGTSAEELADQMLILFLDGFLPRES